MTREAAVAVMIAAAVVILGLMALGWWRRSRRDRALIAPVDALPADAPVRASFETLYVATTAHDDPLERLAVRPLGFRSRATLAVTDDAVVLDLPARTRVVLSAARLVGVGQSTVAIDRVVERDGLARLSWRIDADRVVDSFFRPQDASARALVDAIRPLVPTTASSGADA